MIKKIQAFLVLFAVFVAMEFMNQEKDKANDKATDTPAKPVPESIKKDDLGPADIHVFTNEKTNKLTVIAPVTKFQDGDSFILGNMYKVRLISIDTPEKKQICTDENGQKFNCGEKSHDYLKQLIGNDKLTCEMQGWDTFNRHLFLCQNEKGQVINQEMVRSGYAVMSTYKPFLYKTEEQEAKAQKRGLWSGKFQHPANYRKAMRNKSKTR